MSGLPMKPLPDNWREMLKGLEYPVNQAMVSRIFGISSYAVATARIMHKMKYKVHESVYHQKKSYAKRKLKGFRGKNFEFHYDLLLSILELYERVEKGFIKRDTYTTIGRESVCKRTLQEEREKDRIAYAKKKQKRQEELLANPEIHTKTKKEIEEKKQVMERWEHVRIMLSRWNS